LEDEAIDVSFILEANVREENKIFSSKNYHLDLLHKSRKIASAILKGTHKPLKHLFSIVKSMNDVKIEIIKLIMWKNTHVKYLEYTTPSKQSSFHFISCFKINPCCCWRLQCSFP
jgi:hypothetical protein